MDRTPHPTDLFDNAFFQRPTLTVARDLLGAELSTTVDGDFVSGTIVEVEAYGAKPDPACHAFKGPTPRNEILFREGGYCYVYLIYGMYHCVNVSTEAAGKGCGVLIRAIAPEAGIDIMRDRRRSSRNTLLTSGPGRLCQALAIDTSFSGDHYVTSSRIHLRPRSKVPRAKIVNSTRIGITLAAELPWRFYVRGDPHVSKR